MELMKLDVENEDLDYRKRLASELKNLRRAGETAKAHVVWEDLRNTRRYIRAKLHYVHGRDAAPVLRDEDLGFFDPYGSIEAYGFYIDELRRRQRSKRKDIKQ